MDLIQKYFLELRKRMEKMVKRKGGNAIIAYRQVIDNEGSKSRRFAIRGYGTAVLL
jgi:uncharacterized protein YbjQ (UPF0145 family)